MATIPKVGINKTTSALPAIKLDGYVYFVMDSTYTCLWKEQVITEEYGCNGGFNRQSLHTNKFRWQMTLIVPTNTANLSIEGTLPGTAGTRSNLHSSYAKTGASAKMPFFDITSNWDFTGNQDYDVFLKLAEETPFQNDIGIWQIPIELWGEVYSA